MTTANDPHWCDHCQQLRLEGCRCAPAPRLPDPFLPPLIL